MSTAASAGLRTVLDTNVLVSAFTHHQGLGFQIWQLAINRRFVLLVSPQIVAELAGVLRGKFSWGDERVLREMKFLTRTSSLVAPTQPLHVVEDDDDNRILECAVAGDAALIVSGDRHLRKLGSYQGIGIIAPIEFRRMLGP